TTQVRSGEEALTRITGAQAPSGIPVTITAPTAERRERGGPAPRNRRRPAAAAARRRPARQSAADAVA
ncbi:ATP-dependent helicase, partial [Streptomyces virginiae]